MRRLAVQGTVSLAVAAIVAFVTARLLSAASPAVAPLPAALDRAVSAEVTGTIPAAQGARLRTVRADSSGAFGPPEHLPSFAGHDFTRADSTLPQLAAFGAEAPRSAEPSAPGSAPAAAEPRSRVLGIALPPIDPSRQINLGLAGPLPRHAVGPSGF
jgi:hypothetical protein